MFSLKYHSHLFDWYSTPSELPMPSELLIKGNPSLI